MTNREWIDVSADVSEINSGVLDEVNGVQLTVYAMPSHVPKAVRGYYDQRCQRFVIDFRYDEPRDEDLQNMNAVEHVILKVGKVTQRLYEIEIDVNTLEVSGVGLIVKAKKALESAGAALTPRKSSSYRMAAGVLDRKQAEVSQQLVAAT